MRQSHPYLAFGPLVLLLAAAPSAAAPDLNWPVWRLQMSIVTCDQRNAGTNGGVKVRLNDDNETHLDSRRDDFERGAWEIFDLVPSVGKIRNIKKIEIQQLGSDGWCIQNFGLVVDGIMIYRTSFPSGLWLDNNEKWTVSLTTIKQSADWQAFPSIVAPPTRIASTEMIQRIEGLVGNFIHQDFPFVEKITWIDSPIGVTRKDSKTVHMKFRIRPTLQYNLVHKTCDMTVTADLSYTCSVGCNGVNLGLQVKNVNFEPDGSDLICELIDGLTEPFTDHLNKLYRTIIPFLTRCPTVNVTGDPPVINFAL